MMNNTKIGLKVALASSILLCFLANAAASQKLSSEQYLREAKAYADAGDSARALNYTELALERALESGNRSLADRIFKVKVKYATNFWIDVPEVSVEPNRGFFKRKSNSSVNAEKSKAGFFSSVFNRKDSKKKTAPKKVVKVRPTTKQNKERGFFSKMLKRSDAKKESVSKQAPAQEEAKSQKKSLFGKVFKRSEKKNVKKEKKVKKTKSWFSKLTKLTDTKK